MIRKLLCFLFRHQYRPRPYAEQVWWPYTSLEVCKRCGKFQWREQ